MTLTPLTLTGWVAALAVSTSLLADTPALPSLPSNAAVNASFPAASDFAAKGPFQTTSANEGPNCRIYRPQSLATSNNRHPIILWGNGTGASPFMYRRLLDHWASHGFVVAAARTIRAGNGSEMIDCLNYLEQQNSSDSGTYTNKLDLERVGASGHSQGGGGAIMAGRDSRIITTAPMQPYIRGLGHLRSSHHQQNGPMFLMTGSSDRLASPILNGRPIYVNANVPVFWGNLLDGGHLVPVGNGGDYRGPATAWFRYRLMDDQHAEGFFAGSDCTLCTDPEWEVQSRGIN